MPLISTLGAASSRGFGEFSQSAQANYIENFFNTYLYDGNGGSQIINTGIPLSNTSSWSSYKLQQNNSVGNGIAADTSGNIYIIGYANDGTNDYIIIAKYNSSGTIQWQRSLKQNNSYGYGITTDSSGNIYVTGFPNDGTNSYIIIAKYDTSGTIQWQRKLKQNNSLGYGITTDSSGNVYVTGSANDGATNYIIIAKYNSSGAIQWQRKLKQNASTGRGIVTDSSGNVYITGSANDGSTNYIIIAKYDSSGVIQWQRNLQQNNSSGFGIAADTSGNIYVTGRANDGLNNYTIIAKYNSSGAIQWQRKLKQNISVGYGVTTDSSGNVYVAAYDSDGSINYILVAKYNSSGTIQWQRKLAQNNSFGYGVTTDTSGNVYITGYATDSAQYIVTTKLAQDGSTTSGTAFVDMVIGASTESAGGATDSAGGATDSAGGATDSAGGATDSAGGATASSATQAATTSQGGLVWIKKRAGTSVMSHYLTDSARGISNGYISTNSTNPSNPTQVCNAFNSNGFGYNPVVNDTGDIIASWTFRKQVKFFDVVTYTGNGANRTISHNLGSVPGMILIKRTDTTAAWAVYHRSLANTEYLVLNTTAAKATDATYWNSTTPTSTVFSLGTATDVNANGGTYVAYLFAHDAGGFGADGSQNVISCGGASWSGSTDNFVSLGYEPQYVLFKRTDSTANWFVYDIMRGMSYGSSEYLRPNLSDSAGTYNSPYAITPNATGFTVPSGLVSTGTYIYMAIRRGPMATPTNGTTVFQPTVYTGTNVANRLVNTTIAPDMIWARQRNSTSFGGMLVGDRLRGQPYLATGTTAAEVTNATALDQQIVSASEYGTAFSSMSGVWVGNDGTAQLNASTTASNQIMEGFKRAPGFFDVVCYTGTGSATTVSHKLGVAPELMIVKSRSAVTNWINYCKYFNGGTTPENYYNILNLTDAITTSSSVWNNTSPTSTDFTVGTSLSVSARTYVTYLFASCPGVSKVGSYTGSGTTKQIDCGFTNGARFVLIKRTDSTGDWYVWDTARGIVSGNDPYILLNSTAAEVTSTDYVDPYSAGFELSSTAPAGLNANGGTFIFLAIA